MFFHHLLLFSLPISLNFRFSTDTEEELELVRQLTLEAGAYAAVVANHWAQGGAGAAGKYRITARLLHLIYSTEHVPELLRSCVSFSMTCCVCAPNSADCTFAM